jgi:hypothetical protein
MYFCTNCGLRISSKSKEFCSASCRETAKRKAARDEFIRAYGGRCQCPGNCNVTEPRFLSIDHIGGGGDKHRKKTGVRGWQMYLLVAAEGFPKDKYRILCYNCNMSRAAYGRCPHEEGVK